MVQPLAEAVGRCVAHARAPAMASAARAGPARGGMSPAAARRGRRRRAAAGQANAQASGTTSPELCPPVVDVRPLRRGAWRSAEATNTEARDRAVAEVATALENWGFYSVINHGVDEAVAARFEAAQREFFALPKEEKRRVKRTADNSRGWFDDELTKQRLDWKECFDFGAQDGRLDARSEIDGFNVWPQRPANYREACEEMFRECLALSLDLAAVAALALGLEEDHFDACFTRHTSYLRSNFYPLCPAPADNFGISPHTDAGFLTVLMQDEVASLQVWNNGEWRLVPPVDEGYTINVGDQLQVFSNDRFRAPLHRVLANGERERLSAPFFLNTAYDIDVAPVGVTDEQALYSPVNWGAFRKGRFEGDFANRGVEVQIADYRRT